MSALQLLNFPRSALLVNIDLEVRPLARTVPQVTCVIRVPLPLRLQSKDVLTVWSANILDTYSKSAQRANITLVVAALPIQIASGVLLAITALLAPKSNSIVHQDTIARLRHLHLPNVMQATTIQPMEELVDQHLAPAKIVLQATTAQLAHHSPSNALLASIVNLIRRSPF